MADLLTSFAIISTSILGSFPITCLNIMAIEYGSSPEAHPALHIRILPPSPRLDNICGSIDNWNLSKTVESLKKFETLMDNDANISSNSLRSFFKMVEYLE